MLAAGLTASSAPCAAQSATIETDKDIYRLGETLTLSFTTPDEFPPPQATRHFDISTDHLLPVSDGRFSIGQEVGANESNSFTMEIDEAWLSPSIPIEPWFATIQEYGEEEAEHTYFWIYRNIPSFPGAIDLGGRAVFLAGEDVTVTLSDVPAIASAMESAHAPSSLEIRLYRLGETVLGGGAITDGVLDGYYLEPGQSTVTFPWDEIQAPGRFEVRLIVGGFVLDRVLFDVRLPDTTDAISISLGWDATIADPAALPQYSELQYYRIGREGDRQPAASRVLQGVYEAQVRWNTRAFLQDRTYILDAEVFTVTDGEVPLPPDIELPYGAVHLQVGSGEAVDPGETVTVTATPPEGVDLAEEALWFDVYRIGGYQPDCARVADERISDPTYADLLHPFVFTGSEWPGVYEVRLYRGGETGVSLLQERNPAFDRERINSLRTQFPYAEFVAKATFRVELGLRDDALAFEEGPAFQSGEPIRLHYNLPPARLQNGQDFVSVIRLPEIVPGGATNDPSAHGDSYGFVLGEDWSAYDMFVERQGSFELGAAWLPGAYEVRVYDRYPGAIAYARIGFTVEHPDLPPLPEGFVRPTGLSDWPRDDTPSAVLSPDPPSGCGEPAPVEPMTLSFSHWHDGEIVPLEGVIDYGDAFYVEGRLDEPATREVYEVQLETPGTEPRAVLLSTVEDDPTLLRSELLYVIWDVFVFPGAAEAAAAGEP